MIKPLFPKPLIVSNFQNGVAESPYLGHSVISNLDNSKTNALTLNFRPTPATGVDGYLKWVVTGTTYTYGVSSTGKVYFYTGLGTNTWTLMTGNTLTNATGQGLAFWKGYLFSARDFTIDVFQGNTIYANAWQGTIGGNATYHMFFAAQDGKLYMADGAELLSIEENAGKTFDPLDATTYTVNTKALVLPYGYIITCITELGNLLYLGTNLTTFGLARADIFSWDKTLSTSFDIPIRIGENGVWQMVTRNNTIYAACGDQHTFYKTNGTSVLKLKSMDDLMREYNAGADYSQFGKVFQYPHAGAICNYNGTILFGATYQSNNTDIIYPVGVWSIDDSDKFSMEYETSQGNLSILANGYTFGAIARVGVFRGLSVSIISNNSYNDIITDDFTTSFLYTGYKGYVESQFFVIGTKLVPRTFQQLEFVLGKKLGVGQGVRIKYRKSLADAWTTFGTYDYATLGAVNTHNIPFAIQAGEIQFRIELTTDTNSIYSPELLELRVF